MSDEQKLICARCYRPVELNREYYDTMENMHILCFHFEVEHDGDSDVPCDSWGCPLWHTELYRKKLIELGCDPDKLVQDAIHEGWDRP